MELIDLNPWWKNGKIEEEYEKGIERPLLKKILGFKEERQIISIVGLRRTGKTTQIHQLISHLLKTGIGRENILYYNFDMGTIEIEELLNKFEEETKINLKESKTFVFLDEIQKLQGWNNKLKLIYDLNTKIKFFISGSASLFIEKKTKESLAGRTFSFQLSPLSFKEFLLFKGFETGSNINHWKKELGSLFEEYLKIGGFPELINIKSDEKIKAYIKESIIDRLIYIDIPQVFKIEEPELLIKIMNIISSNPGAVLDFNNLADDLGRNRKTIAAYLFYLEKAFLIKKLYNFSPNLLTSEKKAKKFYPASTAFSYFFEADNSKLTETVPAIFLGADYFYRKHSKEVDFIKIEKNKELSAFEIKYKEKIKKDEISGLKHFFNKFRKKFKIKLFMITKNEEKEMKFEGGTIKLIPAWKFFLETS